jgi:hypothetical protein
VTGWRDPAPGERESADRNWDVIRRAFGERVPAPRRRDRRPLIALAAGVAILAAAFSPPGLAVWGSLRDAVSSEDHLLALPARGSILVNSPAGAWVVQRDGSKRFLSGYANAVWSPHGLYIAAARGNQLVAMEPNGRVHWKLARARAIGGPQWSYEGFRIAYYSGQSLRIVNGDGTGDHLLIRDAVGAGLSAIAWRPGTHQLAFTNARNELVLMDVDRGRILWRRQTQGEEQLAWSHDGQRLFASPRVLDATGKTVSTFPHHSVLLAAFAPRSRALAVVTSTIGRNTLAVYSGPRYAQRRVVFTGAGDFAGIAWSPDARWLLIDWRSADQWLFIRSAAVQRIAVRNIGTTFDSGPEHGATLGGWCCP